MPPRLQNSGPQRFEWKVNEQNPITRAVLVARARSVRVIEEVRRSPSSFFEGKNTPGMAYRSFGNALAVLSRYPYSPHLSVLTNCVETRRINFYASRIHGKQLLQCNIFSGIDFGLKILEYVHPHP